MNVHLNWGGLLGALVGAVVACAVIYLLTDGEAAAMTGYVRYGIGALVISAIAGNVLVETMRGNVDQPPPERERRPDGARRRRRTDRD